MKILRVFLSSPGDTTEQRAVVKEVLDEVNRTVGSRDGFRLDLLTWEQNTYPAVGVDGQDVINNQIGDEYEIFLGIMWKRFGTPTNRSGSGTEEEFERAYKRLREGNNISIMFYFNNSNLPQDLDVDQFIKVKAFKSKIETLGVYHFSFSTTKEFEKYVREHLTGYAKDYLKKLDSNSIIGDKTKKKQVPEISDSFNNFLEDVEATFAHSKVERITLNDIYIPPDLKYLDTSKKESSTKVVNIIELIESKEINHKYILIGNDLAGKTATSKYIFKRYFDLGYYPIFLNGVDFTNNIREEAILEQISDKINEQYSNTITLDSIDRQRVLIIIDDFHKSTKSKNKYWPTLMGNIENIFSNIIVMGNSLMLIENIDSKDPFKNFKSYSILEFGPKFRYKLVNIWNTIGSESRFIDHNEILRNNDAYISNINSIIGKNYVPSYPFYLLTILQAMESGNVQNPNYSIHGFYYELLINESVNGAIKDKKEISLYYNYITHLCFYYFTVSKSEISIDEFDNFHKEYCDRYDLYYKKESILENLVLSKLVTVNGAIRIKEKYILYFFIAKYISNEINNKEEIRELLRRMCERTFKDEYASIILFVTHLSKETFIVNQLLTVADSLFSSNEESKLEDDITSVNQLIDRLPEQVLENVDVQKRRIDDLTEKDEEERLEKELDEEVDIYADYSLYDDVSSIDTFARITRALKMIDILGQVTKKHWGELDGDQKNKLVKTTYNLGLRTLDFYLKYIVSSVDDIVEYIEDLINEKHIKDRFSLKKEIKETVKNYIFRVCFMASFGITKRVSNSIGYDKLKNTYDNILSEHPYNSIKLIDLSIKLGYSSISRHIELVENLKDSMQSSPLCSILLQNLVIDHLYMFDTDNKTKGRLCSYLGISIKDQLIIDQTSRVKRR